MKILIKFYVFFTTTETQYGYRNKIKYTGTKYELKTKTQFIK